MLRKLRKSLTVVYFQSIVQQAKDMRAQSEAFIDARDPPSIDSSFFLHMINVAIVRFNSAYVHERPIHLLKARDY